MSLTLYLDDCAYHKLLVKSLLQDGHSVLYPAQAGIANAKDDVHFDFARQNNLILVTKNPKDFFDLHLSNSNHPGIFAIYQDNDINRDMNHGEIVKAIANVEKALVPLIGQFHILNHWRY